MRAYTTHWRVPTLRGWLALVACSVGCQFVSSVLLTRGSFRCTPARTQARLERLGTGWMGAIFEWEGVLVEDRSAEHRQACLLPALPLQKHFG